MTPSHPNPSTALANTVVDELVRGGVRRFALSPGSRSGALARAAQEHAQAAVAVLIDERSACFFAMGAARMSDKPTAVITTSGTAAANLFPGVVEADRAGVPLIVITADRPPELRQTGANQTIDQINLFGGAVRWFWEAGAAEDRPQSNAYWRASTARAIAEAAGWAGRPGPVHINLPFREPTSPTSHDGRSQAPPFTSPTKGRAAGAPWIRSERTLPSDVGFWSKVTQARRGVVVVGEGTGKSPVYAQLAERLGWPLLAEAMSGLRHPSTITTFHHLLQGSPAALRPDLMLCFGQSGLSPSLSGLLADHSIPQIVVGAPGGWADPNRAVSHLMTANPTLAASEWLDHSEQSADGEWLAVWQEADRVCRLVIDGILDESDQLSEPRIARDLAGMPLDALVVGSSMPVRDVDWFARKTPPKVIGNRGASGIDGLVSTTLGAAWANPVRMACLTGDLALLHDSNGFLVDESLSCVLVVINNNGGGIFTFLPQARHPHFEKLFGTPHGRDFEALAAFHELGFHRLERASELCPTVHSALQAGGLWLVEAQTNREENHRLHKRITTETTARLAFLPG